MFYPIIIRGGRSTGGSYHPLPPEPIDISSAVTVKRRKLLRMLDIGWPFRRVVVGEWWVLVDRISGQPIVKCRQP